jgi:hypothetical protein
LPVRTPREFLAAVHAYHAHAHAAAATGAATGVERGGLAAHRREAFAERWGQTFSVVEAGAEVAADALLHDAVVLRGARVEAGALVADSIVCGPATVRRREHVVRQVVCAAGRTSVDAGEAAR